MDLLSHRDFLCPYCGAENSLEIDGAHPSRQRLIVDCETCCRPIVVRVGKIDGEWELDVQAENG